MDEVNEKFDVGGGGERGEGGGVGFIYTRVFVPSSFLILVERMS